MAAMSRVVVLLLSQVVGVVGKSSVAVHGHKAPDSDAICAAMVYAWELNSHDDIDAKAYRLEGDLNPETLYVLEALSMAAPPLLKDLDPKQMHAIVDTSNPEELPKGIEKQKIHSVVDHHKLGGLTNSEPLEVDVRPLCSAGSVLYARAKAAGVTPPQHIAALMLTSILSDSLEFRSPTTTDTDRVYAKELEKLSGLNAHAHAEAMFEAKAKVDHLTADQLITLDSKIFTIGGKKLRVSVIETTKPKIVLIRQGELVAAMKALATKEKVDDVLFFVVDIFEKAAVFVSASDSAKQIVEEAWPASKVGADGTANLPGVLSRKKQIIPVLEKAAAARKEL